MKSGNSAPFRHFSLHMFILVGRCLLHNRLSVIAQNLTRISQNVRPHRFK